MGPWANQEPLPASVFPSVYWDDDIQVPQFNVHTLKGFIPFLGLLEGSGQFSLTLVRSPPAAGGMLEGEVGCMLEGGVGQA